MAAPDFRRLWIGQTASLIGTQATTVALAWRTFTLTGSAAWLGVVLVTQSTAMLGTTLFAGAIADRTQRKAVLIGADAVRATVMLALAVFDGFGQLSLAAIVLVAIVLGAGDGFFNPAFGGLLPSVTRKDNVASANSLIGLSRQASAVAGPALAGALYEAFSSTSVFALDAASYLFAIVVLARVRTEPLVHDPSGTTFENIREGLLYVMRVPWLWTTFVLFTCNGLLRFGPQQVLLPQLVDQQFQLGVGAYGVLVAAVGFGLTVGILAYGQSAPRHKRVPLLYAISALASLLFAGVALAPGFEVALVLAAAHGGLFGFAVGLWETTLMEAVDGQFLSRVLSVNYLTAFGLMPLGLLGSGAAAAFVPPGLILAGGALISAALYLTMLSRPAIRTLD